MVPLELYLGLLLNSSSFAFATFFYVFYFLCVAIRKRKIDFSDLGFARESYKTFESSGFCIFLLLWFAVTLPHPEYYCYRFARAPL